MLCMLCFYDVIVSRPELLGMINFEGKTMGVHTQYIVYTPTVILLGGMPIAVI